MLYKTGFVSISPTVAEWQATQNCVKDRQNFPTDCYSPHPQWRMGTKTGAKHNLNLISPQNFGILDILCKFILIILVYTMFILDYSSHSFYYMARILVNVTSL